MKNILLFCLICSVSVTFSHASELDVADSAPTVEVVVDQENERVQFLLQSYAEIVSFYHAKIDENYLSFLAAKAAELEQLMNAQLDTSLELKMKLISQNLSVRISH